MKFNTFEKLINEIKKQLETDYERNRELSKALGGDSYVSIDNELLDRSFDIILEDMGADDFIFEIVWDIVTGDVSEKFDINGIEYESNLRNAWLYCKGKLDERYAISKPNNDFNKELFSEEVKEQDRPLLEEILEDIKNIIETFPQAKKQQEQTITALNIKNIIDFELKEKYVAVDKIFSYETSLEYFPEKENYVLSAIITVNFNSQPYRIRTTF